MSRSTWACELKFTTPIVRKIVIKSRSTWACELKSAGSPFGRFQTRHAPRERVSWNVCVYVCVQIFGVVTLHVSVWVEMYQVKGFAFWFLVTLHVSVWVEIVIFSFYQLLIKSRSTWACELKSQSCMYVAQGYCHAPRERVSWNDCVTFGKVEYLVTLHVSVWVEMISASFSSCFAAVTLHVSVWVEICLYLVNGVVIHRHAPRERVSWNCNEYSLNFSTVRHAPRERVSWNSYLYPTILKVFVTLHVSVWVEILVATSNNKVIVSRSTWACELKCSRWWELLFPL